MGLPRRVGVLGVTGHLRGDPLSFVGITHGQYHPGSRPREFAGSDHSDAAGGSVITIVRPLRFPTSAVVHLGIPVPPQLRLSRNVVADITSGPAPGKREQGTVIH